MLEVTEVSCHIYKQGEVTNPNLKAICSFTLGGVFKLHKTTIRQAKGGYLVVHLPYQHNKQNHYYHALNSEFSAYITKTIIDAYLYCLENDVEVYAPKKSIAE